MNVGITILEAEYIEKFLGKPCPFLKDNYYYDITKYTKTIAADKRFFQKNLINL